MGIVVLCFQAEARLLHLHHSQIVGMIERFDENNKEYLVLRLMERGARLDAHVVAVGGRG